MRLASDIFSFANDSQLQETMNAITEVVKARSVQAILGGTVANRFCLKRIVVLLALAVLALVPGELGEITRAMMIDAYIQVSVFVAATLLLFYGAERAFGFELGNVLRRSKSFQVPIAALLGATPGCGGAVIVVAAYSSGNASFGAVVATLTATMGDAAFLLIAVRPDAAIVVLPLSFSVGIVTGWIVDWKFPRPSDQETSKICELAPLIGRTRPRDIAFVALAAVGITFGILQLLQIEPAEPFASIGTGIGIAGALSGLLVWATSPLRAMSNKQDSPLTRTAEETSFISVWVIGAYLLYEYLVAFLGLNLGELFSLFMPVLPLIGVMVGFVPGCGPQLLVTALYINGVIPFAALIGNAISNDGDALFPAIALNPVAAILATAFSAVPALLVSYSFFFFAPGFLN